jgi:hypothetical protein
MTSVRSAGNRLGSPPSLEMPKSALPAGSRLQTERDRRAPRAPTDGGRLPV